MLLSIHRVCTLNVWQLEQTQTLFPPSPRWCYQRAASVPAAAASRSHWPASNMQHTPKPSTYSVRRLAAVRWKIYTKESGSWQWGGKKERASLNALPPISFAHSYEQEIHAPRHSYSMTMMITTHFQGSGMTFFVRTSVSCCCCVVEPARGHTRSTVALWWMDHAYLWRKNTALSCVCFALQPSTCVCTAKTGKGVREVRWACDFEACNNLDLASGQNKAELCMCVCERV